MPVKPGCRIWATNNAVLIFVAATAAAAFTLKDQHPLQSREVAALNKTSNRKGSAPNTTTTCTLVEVIAKSQLGTWRRRARRQGRRQVW